MHDLDMSPYSFTDKAKREQVSPDEEQRLLAAYRNGGDIKARDALCQGMRWVPAVTALKRCKGFDIVNQFYDMYMEGQIALIEAMDSFKMEYGSRFASYAYTACDRAMKTYIRESAGSLVAEPVRVIRDGQRVQSRLYLNTDHSLDAPIGNDEDAGDSYAVMGDRRFNPEDAAEQRELEQRLQQAFTHLSYRERVVVHDCLLGDKTLSDLTEQFGNVSVERVRQIGAKGIEKLRAALLDDAGKPAAPAKAGRPAATGADIFARFADKPSSWHPQGAAGEGQSEPRLMDNRLFAMLVLTGGLPDIIKQIPPARPKAKGGSKALQAS